MIWITLKRFSRCRINDIEILNFFEPFEVTFLSKIGKNGQNIGKFSTTSDIFQTCSNRFLTVKSVFSVQNWGYPCLSSAPLDLSLRLCWPSKFLPIVKIPTFWTHRSKFLDFSKIVLDPERAPKKTQNGSKMA